MAPRKIAKPAAETTPAPVAELPVKPVKSVKAKPAAKAVAPVEDNPEPKPAKSPKAAKAKPAQAPAPVVAEAPTAAPARKGKAKAPVAAPEPLPEPKAELAPKAVVIPDMPLPPLVQALLWSAQNHRAVELIFKETDSNPPRTFEPRHLTFDTLSQAWYIWGWDRRYNAERHHRVDLLAEVNPAEGPGRAAQGPFKEGTPANQIGGWLGGEPIPVKVMLMKQWTFAVKQAPPAFPEFRLEDQEEGKALVSFTATDLRAIARWVMQFGDGVQVLEPARLLDRVKQVGVVWGGKPVAPAPAPAPTPKAESRREERRPEPKHEERRPEPRREERRPEHKREERRDEAKPKGPKVEIRIERL